MHLSRFLIPFAAVVCFVPSCGKPAAEVSEGSTPSAQLAALAQTPLSEATAENAAEELDEIYTLLAYGVVLKDWQTKDTKPARGHNIGGILVAGDGEILHWARNCNKITRNGTQHGEVRLMTGYLNLAKTTVLADCTVYTTLEPCAQCSGMMTLQKVKRTVYGQTDPDFGKAIERLELDSKAAMGDEGYSPYPRGVISDLSRSPIAARIDTAYAQAQPPITSWLLSDDARALYEAAEQRLRSFPLRYEDNRPRLQAAIRYLDAEVSANYTPIPPEGPGNVPLTLEASLHY